MYFEMKSLLAIYFIQSTFFESNLSFLIYILPLIDLEFSFELQKR